MTSELTTVDSLDEGLPNGVADLRRERDHALAHLVARHAHGMRRQVDGAKVLAAALTMGTATDRNPCSSSSSTIEKP